MDYELDRLEQDVERDMDLLRDLPVITPPPECVARVQARVRAEAQRVARRQRVRRWTGMGMGAAAAVLVIVGGALFWHARAAHAPGSDAALSEWAAALDESNARLAYLFSASADAGEDENAELDELFRSLDETLRCFEDLESG